MEATTLISQMGFNAVTLADIAEACDLRGPSVLHYFPTMNDLLAAVLAQRDAESVQPPPSRLSPQETRHFLRAAVEQNLQIREIIRLYVVLGAEALDSAHPAHAYLDNRRTLALESLEGLLWWKPDPSTAARQLYAFWGGLETLWAADPSLDFLKVWDAFGDTFFD